METKVQGLTLKVLTIILVIINIPSGFGVDGHSASLPAMATHFGVKIGYIQATISLYLLGYAVGSPLIGLVSEYKGRLWAIRRCAPLYMLGCLLAIFAHHVLILLFGRFVQGVGASIFGTLQGILLNEACPEQQKSRLGAYVTMGYAVTPIVAPVIGGYIQHYLGWQYNLGLMLLLCFLTVVVTLWLLPETSQSINAPAQSLRNFFQHAYSLLRHLTYLRYCILNGTLWGLIPIYNSIAPFVIQDQLKYSAVTYGHLTLLVGVASFVGSLITTKLPKKWGAAQKILPGKIFLFGVSLINLAVYYLLGLTLVTFIIPIFFMIVACSYLYTIVYVEAVNCHQTHIGMASALVGSVTCIVLPLLSYIIFYFHIGTALPFDWLLVVLATLSLLLFPKVVSPKAA